MKIETAHIRKRLTALLREGIERGLEEFKAFLNTFKNSWIHANYPVEYTMNPIRQTRHSKH
jgi:hypothetical protein